MAETIIAVGAAISASATAAATSVSTFFAAGSTGASTLSTVLTVGSALASIGGGIAANNAAKDSAEQVGLQMIDTRAQGAQRISMLSREFAEISADQTAVQLANGLNPGVGTAATVRKATAELADRNIATTRENTRNRIATQRLQQRSLLSSGRAALAKGIVNAGTTALSGFSDVGSSA